MDKLADGGTRMMRLVNLFNCYVRMGKRRLTGAYMSIRKGHDRIGGRNTFGRACHNVFRMPQGILISL